MLSTVAHAQSINIDFGNGAGQPDAEFGGAAVQDGAWNAIAPEPGVPAALIDLSGNGTAATITTTRPTATMQHAQISGDDEALLEDGLLGNGNVASTITFHGLQAGTYTIVIYGFTPAGESALTSVIPPAGMENVLTIGGAWPDQYVVGVTHETFEVTVAGEPLRIDYVGSFAGSDGFLNGLQLTKVSGGVEQRPEDLNADGLVGVQDLLILLTEWSDGHGCDGVGGSCSADFNNDNVVDILDMLHLLSAWG